MIKIVVLIGSLLFIMSFMTSNLFAVPADKEITWAGGGQGQVTFEGEEHAEKGYKCDSCHPSLFQMKKDSVKITLASHTDKTYCGACHNGKTAFGTDNPEKCYECHEANKQQYRKKNRHKHND